MNKLVAALGFILCLSTPASAGQFEYILKFASLAAAKADPQVQQHYDQLQDVFAQDRIIASDPYGTFMVWRKSQDTIDGQGNVVHTPLSGWYMVISLDRLAPALRDYSATQLTLDRDKCNNRVAGCVVATQLSHALLEDVRFQPVFAGADYPFSVFQ